MEDGIKALDKTVAEATEQRKEESSEYKTKMQSDAAAKELLVLANERLSKFYNKASPSFAQVSLHRSREGVAREAPEGPKTYTKSAASAGVMSAITTLMSDLETEMTEAKVEEEHSQKLYEEFMEESANKRKADAKSLADQREEIAEMKSQLGTHNDEKVESGEQLTGFKKVLSNLHNDCDFLLKFFDTRKEARSNEIDGLIKSRAVLSNADLDL